MRILVVKLSEYMCTIVVERLFSLYLQNKKMLDKKVKIEKVSLQKRDQRDKILIQIKGKAIGVR